MEKIVEEVSRLLSLLKGGGFRGLLILIGEPEQVYELLGRLGLKGLLVYWPGIGVDAARRILRGWSLVYAGHLADRLGEEYEVVVVDCYEGLQANTLAAAAEMVRGGGVLVLTGRDRGSFSAPGSLGFFALRLWRIIEGGVNVAIVDLARGSVVSWRWVRGPNEWLPGARDVKGAPGWLRRLACCPEQVEVAVRAEKLLRRYEAGVLLVTGDRGRGKSAATGLALAYLIYRKLVGDVVVTGPSLHSVQSLFQWLTRGLREAGIRFKAWGPGRLYQGVKGAWFRVRYLEPWRVEPAPLVVVEEAAAVGPARVRRIAGRSRNVIAVTTIHGYEGSGRYWLRVLVEQLPPVERVELKTPVRYAPGDPLEKLLYELLLLKTPEPDELPVCQTVTR